MPHFSEQQLQKKQELKGRDVNAKNRSVARTTASAFRVGKAACHGVPVWVAKTILARSMILKVMKI
jgi:hypothetical protein